MSANAFVEDIESSRKAGMNAHISKPVNIAKLLGIMEDYLGTHVKRFVIKLVDDQEEPQATPARYYEELMKESEGFFIELVCERRGQGTFCF